MSETTPTPPPPDATPAATSTPAPAPATATATATAATTTPVAPITIEQFFATQLRVAKIISAEPIPKSKKLLKLKVSLGAELGERQILAGIAAFYPPETLVGRKIVIVANLAPAKLMGEESQGMLLAASADNAVVLLDPGQNTPEGSVVR